MNMIMMMSDDCDDGSADDDDDATNKRWKQTKRYFCSSSFCCPSIPVPPYSIMMLMTMMMMMMTFFLFVLYVFCLCANTFLCFSGLCNKRGEEGWVKGSGGCGHKGLSPGLCVYAPPNHPSKLLPGGRMGRFLPSYLHSTPPLCLRLQIQCSDLSTYENDEWTEMIRLRTKKYIFNIAFLKSTRQDLLSTNVTVKIQKL